MEQPSQGQPEGTSPVPGAVRGEARSKVDPRVQRSREALVEAALQEFLREGYRDASLDDIAGRADVAKRTIYNVFADKEALFRAVLAEAMDTAERFSAEVVAHLGDDTEDFEQELRQAAIALARAVLSGRIVPLRRLLIAEVRRFPELAEEYYTRAPGRVMSALAEAFRRYRDAGVLSIDDPARAGEQFAFLVLGASLDHGLFTPDDEPADPALVERRALAGVEAFLRAHRPSGQAG